MGLDGTFIPALKCTALTETRCHLHSRARPPVPHSASISQSMQHRTLCTLQASMTGLSRKATFRPGSPESTGCCWPDQPCTIAHDGHRASLSINSTPQRPAMLHSSSLRHKCLPLDRRWPGQPSTHCLSDAVGPLAGSGDVEPHDRSTEEHSEHQAQASQVCAALYAWPACNAATTDL